MNYFNKLLGIFLFLILCEGAFSQFVIVNSDKFFYENDSVILVIDNEVRGDIHWEVSKDKVNWTTIPGSNSNTLYLHVDSSTFYRAVITEGTCNPVYSDTVSIAELYDKRDGQIYDVVNIGSQWWMAENLNFNTQDGSWYYDNDSLSYADTYGRLYSWEAALNACPFGWHLPTDEEWKVLEREIGMDSIEANNTGWRGTDQGDQLKTGAPLGFNILFAGFMQEDSSFNYLTSSGTFWSSTTYSGGNAWYRGFGSETQIHRYYYSKDMAFSVRCLRNNTPIIEAQIVADSTTKYSAVIEANVIYDGGDSILSKGLCWGTSIDPDFSSNIISVGSGLGIFTGKITGLTPNTTYYARAYAYNSSDTAFTENIEFVSVSKPILTTNIVSGLTLNSAVCGGNITDDGGVEVTARGVCWSMVPHPTTDDNITVNGLGIGSYSSSVTGLIPNTTYYIRAYAINSIGTAYGNERIFRTLPVSQIDDITDIRDGRDYRVVKIGSQWWFAENLNYEKANSWCYDDNTAYCDTFGRLYTWNASLNSCPSGWHMPSDADWKILERYLGMDSLAAEDLDWRGTNQGTQLKDGAPLGFNVLYGGFRQENGDFVYLNSSGTFWTSEQYTSQTAWYRGFGSVEENIHRYYYDKDMAFSVRCLKTNPPEVITDSVYDVTKTMAKIDARVISEGGESVTQRGVCYSQSPGPTVFDNKYAVGSSIGPFTAILTGLATNKTYYLRAYAINDADTGYSNEVTFITITAPVVLTIPASSITKTSAVVGGNVTDNGGSPVTQRGVCYSTSPDPSYFSSRLVIGSGSGSFATTLSGLSSNRTYYLKAYAINVKDTAYGNEISFKTLPVYPKGSITDPRDGKHYSTINIGDQWWMAENLNHSGGGTYCYDNNAAYCDTFGRLYRWSTAVGACPSGWHLPSDEDWKTLEMELGMSQSAANNTGWRGTDQGTQLKAEGPSGFDVLMGGFRNLSNGYEYINSSGTFWTSTEVVAGTAWYRGFGLPETNIHRDEFEKNYGFSVRCVKNKLPVVTTASISSVTDSSATGGGEVTYDGGAVTTRGVCWSTSHGPTTANDITDDGEGEGPFISTLSDLLPNTTYYVRAYATNNEGTTYGDEVSFTTLVGLPRLTTSSVASITDSSAVSGGTITSSGGLSITAKGICWSITEHPDINDDHTSEGTGSGAFVSIMENLDPNTTYYVRAYATNGAGTGYGNELSFVTVTAMPKVTTSTVTAVDDVSATTGGNVTYDGGVTVTARGVCWSTGHNPNIYNDHTSDGAGTGVFVSLITGLTPGTEYFVRAYATNSNGTAYGSELSFTTSSTLATVTTAAITGETVNSATGGGDVTDIGGSPVTARGVCWSIDHDPDLLDDHTTNGAGAGVFASSIGGLTPGTEYFVRAYATNSAGTAYGNEVSFSTLNETGTLEDTRDSQVYNTIKIGDQWWMAENLNFRPDTGSWYYGDDSATYAEEYGRLYRWETAMAGAASSNDNPSGVQGVCPSGWHLPSDAEWTDLTDELGVLSIAGGMMKEEGYAHWSSPNTGATNESGFTALPAGERTDAEVYQYILQHASYWSTTQQNPSLAKSRTLYYDSGSVTSDNIDKEYSFSIRCVKD
jgi:uncharacterized protein (TIGR02145 family)